MQDRIRHMHEVLPKKIARSISRYQAKARLLALLMANLPALAAAQDARSQAPPYCFDLTPAVDRGMTKERFAPIAVRQRPGRVDASCPAVSAGKVWLSSSAGSC